MNHTQIAVKEFNLILHIYANPVAKNPIVKKQRYHQIMKKYWEKFLHMVATSPVGTALKIGFGASAVWLLDNISAFNLSPALSAVVIAILTIAINYLNPQDSRYGRGSAE